MNDVCSTPDIIALARSVLAAAHEPSLGFELVVHPPPDSGGWWGYVEDAALGIGEQVGPEPPLAAIVIAPCPSTTLELLVHEIGHLATRLLETPRQWAAREEWVERKLQYAPAEYWAAWEPPPRDADEEWWKDDFHHNALWFRACAHLAWRLELTGQCVAWPCMIQMPGVWRWRRLAKAEATTFCRAPLSEVLRRPVPRRQLRWLQRTGVLTA